MNVIKHKIKEETITFRNGSQNDIPKIISSIKESLGVNYSTDYLNWKYKMNDKSTLFIIAENESGNIIGQIGHRIQRGLYKGKDVKLLNTFDMGVQKEYRGYGISGKFYQLFPKKPYVLFGFSNQSAFASFKKFGDEFNSRISKIILSSMVKRIDLFTRIKMIYKDCNLYSFSKASSNSSKEINDLWQAKKNEIKNCVIRDFDYLNWRVLSSPSNLKLYLIKKNNKVISYIVVHNQNKTFYLADMIVLNNELNKEIIISIEKFLISKGARNINFATNDTNLLKYFIVQGYKFDKNIEVGSYNGIEKNVIFTPYLTYLDMDLF